MTQINYDKITQPSINGENMMDRSLAINDIGDCVWVNWMQGDKNNGINIIDVHCKEDVLNNFNPLLAYNVHPYTTDNDDCIAGSGSPDVSCVGNVMRIAYHYDDRGAIAIVGFFVHPRFRGKGMAKDLFAAGVAIISIYADVQTIVLNPKSHSTSPVDTAVLRMGRWALRNLVKCSVVLVFTPVATRRSTSSSPRRCRGRFARKVMVFL